MLKSQSTSFPCPRQARGFTLIEVLITVVILAIGLLSLAALQLSSLRSNNAALTRFEATNLVYDILDRMRANRTPAIQGDYNITLAAAAPGVSTDVALTDVREWILALAANLPGGDGSIVQTAAPNQRRFTITVQWSESWDGTLGGQPMTLVFRTDL